MYWLHQSVFDTWTMYILTHSIIVSALRENGAFCRILAYFNTGAFCFTELILLKKETKNNKICRLFLC